MKDEVAASVEACGLSMNDIRLVVPHQVNMRIIESARDKLSLRDEDIAVNIQKYGNTSGSSIPIAINDLYESGKLHKGEMMLLDAFGGGLTWGSALVPFAGPAEK